jgi:hypothetical protein
VVTGTHQIKSGLRLVLALAALVALLAMPTQALANENCNNAGNDPTAAQYCSVAGAHAKGGENTGGPSGETQPVAEEPVVEAVAEEPVAATAAPESSGTLPFTGLDVGILAAVAVALVGTGFVLRRLTASGVTRS